MLSNFEKQNWFIDITATIDKKIDALAAHASQMPDMSRIESLIRDQAAQLGAKTGSQYAEGFVRIEPMR
ncbi:MAG: hypothetical protein ABIV43_02890 [Candidatus Saccharimonadales bacterium]